MPQLPRYASSPAVAYHDKPISYFAGQYAANSPNALFPPNSTSSTATLSTFHQAQPSPFALSIAPPSPFQQHHDAPLDAMAMASPLTASASDPAAERKEQGGGHHARNSSLSLIQQKQSVFFSDDGGGVVNPTLNDDDDDDVYGDAQSFGGGKGQKSRSETEDVWCCTVCTFWNSLLLPHCELCGAKKAANPQIVKVWRSLTLSLSANLRSLSVSPPMVRSESSFPATSAAAESLSAAVRGDVARRPRRTESARRSLFR